MSKLERFLNNFHILQFLVCHFHIIERLLNISIFCCTSFANIFWKVNMIPNVKSGNFACCCLNWRFSICTKKKKKKKKKQKKKAPTATRGRVAPFPSPTLESGNLWGPTRIPIGPRCRPNYVHHVEWILICPGIVCLPKCILCACCSLSVTGLICLSQSFSVSVSFYF